MILVKAQQIAAAAALQQLQRCLPQQQQQQRKGPPQLSANDGFLFHSIISRADSYLGGSLGGPGGPLPQELEEAGGALEGAVKAVLLMLQQVCSKGRSLLEQQLRGAPKGPHIIAAAAEWEKSCSKVLQLLTRRPKLLERLPETTKGKGAP